MLYSFIWLYTLFNPCPNYSLVNSVDFAPNSHLFCVTYTHGNRVVLYEEGRVVQELTNPLSHLSEPQHAVFSPDGKQLVVANWTNQTLTIYQKIRDHFLAAPVSIATVPKDLANARPHGLAFSPCGNYLALAYGASSFYEKALALIRLQKNRLEWACVLKDLPGIPKGITFTPDGSHLLVTFADLNAILVYECKEERIDPKPKQVIYDASISRPEDIKITPDDCFVAISNSDKDNLTFYPFNDNRLTDTHPCYTLKGFCFPHGLSFSKDGKFLAVTEFGPVQTTPSGDIVWETHLAPEYAKVKVLKRIGP